MSSAPYPEGVAALRQLLIRRRELSVEWHDLTAKVARLKECERELHSVNADIMDSLKSMDVHTTHNAGWERRFLELLNLLEKQASEKPP